MAETLGQVLGESVRRVRERLGLTQHEAAARLRGSGLRWHRSQLAALEAGNRDTVDLGTALLLAAALQVPLAELVAGEGAVSIGTATLTREQVRDWLSGGQPEREPTAGPASFQADAELAERLGLRPEEVYRTAERLWGRTLHQERDRRIEEAGEMTAAQRRARRGHVTRQLAREIEPHLPTRRRDS